MGGVEGRGNNFIMFIAVGNLVFRKKYGFWRKVELDFNFGFLFYKLCGFERLFKF